MVAFSGGKALAGPSGTGLLLGKKELIDAAQAQHVNRIAAPSAA